MNSHFACESRDTLKSFTLLIVVKVITKLNLGHGNKSGKEFSRRSSPSPDNAEFGHFKAVVVLQIEDGKEMGTAIVLLIKRFV